MIDIPPGASSSSSQPISVTATPSVDSVKAAVQAKLEAVVQEVQVRNPAGQPDSKSWDVLLRLNPQASGTPIQANALTPDLMRALQAGQAVLLQTRTTQPLPVESRLQVTVSIAQGVQIQNLQPPALPPQTLAQLKQFIHQQQPLAPLLANLLHLLQRDQQNQLTALPLRTQAAIAQVIASLPDPQAVRAQLKTWVENSGLLQEAKLAQAVKPQGQTTDTLRSMAETSGKAPAPAAAATATLQQIRQQVQEWVQRLRPEGDTRSSAPAVSAPQSTANALSPVTAALENDIKHQLQQLERQLQSTGAAATKSEASNTKAPTPATPGQPAADPDIITPESGSGRKPGQPMDIIRTAESTAREPNSSQSAQPRSPLAIQRYQASAPAAGTARSAVESTTPDLIPPLPGQVVVQAQARARPSLKDDDMADAIVKTLLAQVRGALARVTLHQLSSHSARQDSATPTSLSFEIPFLHNSQVEVFQFRIDEDTPRADERREKNQAKRWVVQLGFDIEGLGPMFCQLSLSGKSMAVQFWAAWEQTLNSTKAHFSFLEKSLQDMGIRVEKIQAQLGMPEIDRTGVRNQLVDVKT